MREMAARSVCGKTGLSTPAMPIILSTQADLKTCSLATMPKSLSLCAACSLCVLISQACFAQRYSFKHYGPNDGLSTAVSRLLQDRDGFLWVGTANGLYRYDGQRFHRFGTADGLPSMSVLQMHQSSDGTLWVVTAGGLARLRHNKFERVNTGLPQELERLFGLDSDQQGRLYLGTNKGLLVGEPAAGGHIRFRLLDGVPGVPALAVF